jgi:predicted nucleic acid-binding protein
VILVDTSGLLSALDSDDPDQRRTSAAIRASRGPRLLSPFVLAELDYLLGRRVGTAIARRLLDEVAGGAYRLEPFDAEDVRRAAAIIDRYQDLDLGLADASIVVLAERHGVNDIVTLDERHFRAVLGPGGRPFRILPADAPAA